DRIVSPQSGAASESEVAARSGGARRRRKGTRLDRVSGDRRRHQFLQSESRGRDGLAGAPQSGRAKSQNAQHARTRNLQTFLGKFFPPAPPVEHGERAPLL